MAEAPAAFHRPSPCDGEPHSGRFGSAMPRSAADASRPGAAAVLGALLALLACPHPATAQFSPAPAFPVGELHRIELLGSLWSPAQDLTVASRGSGAPGATTGAAADGATAAPRFTDLRVRLRPSRRQRIHLDYLPTRYPAATTLDRGPAPDGTGLEPGVPAASTLTWTTWRLAYEYDVVHVTRASLGLFAEAAFTDVQVVLDGAAGAGCDAASAACDLARLRRPVPAAGGVVRLYPSPVIMLGAEASLLRVPEWAGDILGYTGEHLAYDVHAALNFVEAFGLQIGYRSRSLRLRTTDHDADLELEGVYVGALLRF